MPAHNSDSAEQNQTVGDLVGDEGGMWQVTTRTSHYILDLDEMTIERIPGPDARPSVNDFRRRLREIRACAVGQSGHWTMQPEGGTLDPVEFYWQVSSPIRSIERTNSNGGPRRSPQARVGPPGQATQSNARMKNDG